MPSDGYVRRDVTHDFNRIAVEDGDGGGQKPLARKQELAGRLGRVVSKKVFATIRAPLMLPIPPPCGKSDKS